MKRLRQWRGRPQPFSRSASASRSTAICQPSCDPRSSSLTAIVLRQRVAFPRRTASVPSAARFPFCHLSALPLRGNSPRRRQNTRSRCPSLGIAPPSTLRPARQPKQVRRSVEPPNIRQPSKSVTRRTVDKRCQLACRAGSTMFFMASLLVVLPALGAEHFLRAACQYQPFPLFAATMAG